MFKTKTFNHDHRRDISDSRIYIIIYKYLFRYMKYQDTNIFSANFIDTLFNDIYIDLNKYLLDTSENRLRSLLNTNSNISIFINREISLFNDHADIILNIHKYFMQYKDRLIRDYLYQMTSYIRRHGDILENNDQYTGRFKLLTMVFQLVFLIDKDNIIEYSRNVLEKYHLSLNYDWNDLMKYIHKENEYAAQYRKHITTNVWSSLNMTSAVMLTRDDLPCKFNWYDHLGGKNSYMNSILGDKNNLFLRLHKDNVMGTKFNRVFYNNFAVLNTVSELTYVIQSHLTKKGKIKHVTDHMCKHFPNLPSVFSPYFDSMDINTKLFNILKWNSKYKQ